MLATNPMPGPPTHTAGSAREQDAYLGMVIFLAGWTLMFGGLFFAYIGVRINSRVWPPAGQPALPVALAALNTGVLLASSLTAQLGLRAIRNWQVGALRRWLVATLGLGALFHGLQWLQWSIVWARGLRP